MNACILQLRSSLHFQQPRCAVCLLLSRATLKVQGAGLRGAQSVSGPAKFDRSQGSVQRPWFPENHVIIVFCKAARGQRCSSELLPGVQSSVIRPRLGSLGPDNGGPAGQARASSGWEAVATRPGHASSLGSPGPTLARSSLCAPGAPLRNAAEAAHWSLRSAGSSRCRGDDL